MPTYRNKLTSSELALIDRYLDLLHFGRGIRGIIGKSGKTEWSAVQRWNGKVCQGHRAVKREEVKTALAKQVCLARHLPVEGPVPIYGSRFGWATRYGLIDLDAGSKYRTQEWADALLHAGRSVGIDLVVCQSSRSTGRWLMVWCDVPIRSILLGELLSRLCIAAGVPVLDIGAKGFLEVYPQREAMTQCVRYPGQAGWGLSDPSSIERVIFEVEPTSELDGPRTVIEISERRSNTLEALAEALVSLREVQGPFPDAGLAEDQAPSRAPAGAAPQRKAKSSRWQPSWPEILQLDSSDLDASVVARYDAKSEHTGRPQFLDPLNRRGIRRWLLGKWFFQNGLPARGTREQAIFAVGFYLWFTGMRDPAKRLQAMIAWMEAKNNGNSARWNRSPDQVREDIRRAVYSGWSAAPDPHEMGLIEKYPTPTPPTDTTGPYRSGADTEADVDGTRHPTTSEIWNRRQAERARERIRDAIVRLVNIHDGRESAVTAAAVIKQAKCSKTTLTRFRREAGLRPRQWTNKAVLGDNYTRVVSATGPSIIPVEAFIPVGLSARHTGAPEFMAGIPALRQREGPPARAEACPDPETWAGLRPMPASDDGAFRPTSSDS